MDVSALRPETLSSRPSLLSPGDFGEGSPVALHETQMAVKNECTIAHISQGLDLLWKLSANLIKAQPTLGGELVGEA
jgi:hypothetical protein